MIRKPESIRAGEELRADVCVIGSGAGGISLAMELGRGGIDVLLIPGGDLKYRAENQELYKGTSDDGIPLERSRQRRFGGTTAVWGGRCIPLDPIDFRARPFVEHSGWPIEFADVSDYYRRAQEYVDIGTTYSYDVAEVLPDGPTHMIEGFDDDVLLTNRIEKFSLPTNLGKKYYPEIEKSSTIRAVMDSYMTRVHYTGADDEVAEVACATNSGTPFTCQARRYVLATGALETTRHLLQPTDTKPEGAGNKSGMLGRFFMTHLSGVISEIAIDPKLKMVNKYEKDREGVYCRRRLQLSEQAQEDAGILNFSSFLHHPPLQDAGHRNPLLSLLFLAKGLRAVAFRIPAEYSAELAYGKFGWRDYIPHLRNVILGIPQLLARAPDLVYKRLIRKRKLPSLIIDDKNNRCTLHYHVEHAPHPESRVTLSDEKDANGLRRLHVAMHYKDIDVQSILTAHNIIKERLELAGVGTLTFVSEDPLAHIKKQIAWGGHQLGTTRMAHREEDGVVDVNCKVFGVSNLYVAAPSVFPTGGQANPVLTIVTLAIRLADHLRATAG